MQEEQKPREAIWSVPAGWLRIYLTLFVIETSVCLGLVIWHEITTRAPGDNFVAVLIAVGGSMAPLILTIATANVGLVEVTYMLDRLIGERYRQHRYQAGRREGHTEGREEGREVGREEGREVGREEGREVGREEGREVGREEGREVGAAEMHHLWEGWFERFCAAQEAGEEFSEPQPPRPHPNGKNSQTE